MSLAFDALRERLTSILLTTPEEEMYADVLDLVRERFASTFGFFGYVSTSGDLVCPSMTRDIFPQCQVPDKSIVFPRAIWGGLWGRILIEQRSLLKNEAHAVPQGHLPIERSFGSPILYRGELIGSLHLANRNTDYQPEDVALLEEIAAFLAPVLNARLRRDEEERRRRDAEERLITANAELQVKVAELERLTEALIDREERMVELKRELGELKKRG